MDGSCKLCGQKADIRESHIVPSFAYRWLKESSVTGHLRFGEAMNRRVQDGEKAHLLCSECELRFSVWEKAFAEEVFAPVNAGAPLKGYGPWLLKFSTSLSWRVLTVLKHDGQLKHFSPVLLAATDTALATWKDVLLDKQPHPGPFEQHILPFPGLVANRSDPNMPSNFNRYISRSVDVDAFSFGDQEGCTYVKICRVLLLGFISLAHPDRWRDTKIHVKQGTLQKQHWRVPDQVSSFLYYKARRQQNLEQELSDRQLEKIHADYQENAEKFPASDMFRAVDQDYTLFGEAAFTEKKGR